MPSRKSAAAAARLPSCRSYAASDQGQQRTNNEDRCFANDEEGVYFVIDGVGGMAGGERAALLAEGALLARLRRRDDEPERRIREGIALAGKAIFEEASRNPELKGMSCVMTVAVIEQGVAHVGHVGDTRLYLFSGNQIRKVTRDHSPVGQAEDASEISEEEAMRHPRRNEIFRDVGSQLRGPDDPNFIEITRLELDSGSAMLLCSDGLTDELTAAQIREAVLDGRGDPARVTRRLIARANDAGGRDNVSVVYVEGPGTPPTPRASARFFSKSRTPDQIDTVEMNTPLPPLKTVERRGWMGYAAVFIIAFPMGPAAYYLTVTRLQPPAPSLLAVKASGGSPYRAISQALAAAKPGDTIVVSPGLYLERLVLRDGVHIVARPAGGAMIQPRPETADPAPVVEARNLQQVSISGLTIAPAPGSGSPIGLLAENSGVEVLNMEIYGMREAGILVRGAGNTVIRGSYLHQNGGPAIIVEAGASPQIIANRIVDNGGADGTRPALIVGNGAAAGVQGNWFSNNRADIGWKGSEDALDRLRKDNFFSPVPQPPKTPSRKRR
jgi:serine/threonine protein phosphatase PrpC